MLTQLIKFGLSEKEAKVYLAALELGAETAQRIARKAGVNRATTYVILQGLMKKGLTSTFTKGKKTFFSAEPPEQLDHLLRKQEEDIFEQRRDLEKIIPELRALYNRAEGKPKVRFFEGEEGVHALIGEFFRKLPKESTLYAILALDELLRAFPTYFDFQTGALERQKIHQKILYSHPDGEQELPNGHSEAIWIHPDRAPFAASVLISPHQHRIAILSFEHGTSGVLIDNAAFSQTLLTLFQMIWQKK